MKKIFSALFRSGRKVKKKTRWISWNKSINWRKKIDQKKSAWSEKKIRWSKKGRNKFYYWIKFIFARHNQFIWKLDKLQFTKKKALAL